MRQLWKRAVIGVALVGCAALTSCAEPTGACVDHTYDSDFGTSETVCVDDVDASQCQASFSEGKTCQDLGLQSCPVLLGALAGTCG